MRPPSLSSGLSHWLQGSGYGSALPFAAIRVPSASFNGILSLCHSEFLHGFPPRGRATCRQLTPGAPPQLHLPPSSFALQSPSTPSRSPFTTLAWKGCPRPHPHFIRKCQSVMSVSLWKLLLPTLATASVPSVPSPCTLVPSWLMPQSLIHLSFFCLLVFRLSLRGTVSPRACLRGSRVPSGPLSGFDLLLLPYHLSSLSPFLP